MNSLKESTANSGRVMSVVEDDISSILECANFGFRECRDTENHLVLRLAHEAMDRPDL